jgi:hypothetical protein
MQSLNCVLAARAVATGNVDAGQPASLELGTLVEVAMPTKAAPMSFPVNGGAQ